MQLKVIKSDRSVEEYMHTKVLGTLSNALAATGQPNVFAAEQFADAVTYYLHRPGSAHTITSDEIHLLIQSVLTSTGYGNAAKALTNHRLNRGIKRSRLHVVRNNSDAELSPQEHRWSKSRIVEHLTQKKSLHRNLSRAIAGTVEEKVLNIGMSRIPAELIGQLVLADTESMLSAQQQLQELTV